jgi:chromosomal replication initiation ATPase DnaA
MHTPEQIIAAVAAVTGVPVEKIKGRRRNTSIVRARALSVVMIYQVKSWWSQERIASHFTFKGRSSVLYYLQQHEWWQRSLPEYRRQAIALEFQLFTTATR